MNRRYPDDRAIEVWVNRLNRRHTTAKDRVGPERHKDTKNPPQKCVPPLQTSSHHYDLVEYFLERSVKLPEWIEHQCDNVMAYSFQLICQRQRMSAEAADMKVRARDDDSQWLSSFIIHVYS
jgi:hypothetical protein